MSAARRHGGLLVATCALVGLTAWACGDSTSDGGGAGGEGGGDTSSSASTKSSTATKAASTTATTNSQSVTNSTTAAGLGCNPPAVPPSDGACVTLTAGATTSATSSGTGSTGTGTGSTGAGAGAIECNPVTNEPCAAGEACDANQGGGFSCFPPPNDALVCEGCDAANGPFCEGGSTCAGDTCFHFCCTDADCGDVACVKTDDGGAPLFEAAPDLGLCPPA